MEINALIRWDLQRGVLYVDVGGITIIRVCRLPKNQVGQIDVTMGHGAEFNESEIVETVLNNSGD